LSERELQRCVLQVARLFGWRVFHCRPARTKRGAWRTPVEADGAGFLDLVLVRERLLFRELKGNGGRLRDEQVAWLNALLRSGADAGVWTPADWTSGRIEAELRGER
jgi:hypothetical protein